MRVLPLTTDFSALNFALNAHFETVPNLMLPEAEDTGVDLWHPCALRDSASSMKRVTGIWGSLLDQAKKPILTQMRAFESRAKQVQNSTEAIELMEDIRAFDPNSSLEQVSEAGSLMFAKQLCREMIFNERAPQPEAYVEVFTGDERYLSINDQAGKNVIAGLTQRASYKKRLDQSNQDVMAIVRCLDGGRIYLVGDGRGGGLFGGECAEVIVRVVAERMSVGASFKDALKDGIAVWEIRKRDLVAQKAAQEAIQAYFGHFVIDADGNAAVLGDLELSLKEWMTDHAEVSKVVQTVLEAEVNGAGPRSKPLLDRLEWAIRQSLEKYPEFELFREDEEVNSVPGTTLVGVREWEEEGTTYVQYFNLGDCSFILYEKLTDGTLQRIEKSKEHSQSEELYQRGLLTELLKDKGRLSVQAADRLARISKRSHPLAHVITHLVDHRGSHVPFAQVSDPIPLESGRVYVGQLMSDGFGDNVDDLYELPDLYYGTDSSEERLILLHDYTGNKYFREAARYHRIKRYQRDYEASQRFLFALLSGWYVEVFSPDRILYHEEVEAQKIAYYEGKTGYRLVPVDYYNGYYHTQGTYLAVDGIKRDDQTAIDVTWVMSS